MPLLHNSLLLLLLLVVLLLVAYRFRLLLFKCLALLLLLLRLPPTKLRHSRQHPWLLLPPLPPSCSRSWVATSCVTAAAVCAAALRGDAVKQLQDIHVCISRHSRHGQQQGSFQQYVAVLSNMLQFSAI
jgi:hypothetical protein